MVPISPARRTAANRLPAAGPRSAEGDHFYVCPGCGQTVDCRRLGDVIHHESADHAPLPPE